MNAVDVFIVLGLSFFGFKGYMHGFVHELLSLTAMMAALAAAFRWTPLVVPRIAEAIPGPAFVDTGVGFMLLFALVLWTGRYVVTLVGRFWVQARSSPANRAAGLSFGIFKGAVLLGCTILALRAHAPEAHASEVVPDGAAGAVMAINGRVEQSILAPRLADLTSEIFSAVMTRAETGVRQLSPEDSKGVQAIEGS
jgi:membrane protein required for colicin V production